MCLAAARIAVGGPRRLRADGRPRFVAGSMGPGTKLPSLGHVAFVTLRDAYEVMARGLIEGGVDLLLIETCYDLLQAKAAVIGARRAMAAEGRARADAAAGDDGDDGSHARRQRDRCRARLARSDEARHLRAQLRHRPPRDDRAPAPSLPALQRADLGAAERRPAEHRPRSDALRPHARRARRVPHPLRHRLRRASRRRMLRHDAGAHRAP